MDFASFSLEEMAARGSVCHLRSYLDKSPLYAADGTPVTFTLLGKDSRDFRKAVARVAARDQALLKRGNKEYTAEQLLAEMDRQQKNNADIFTDITVGTTGVYLGKKLVGSDKKLIRRVLDHRWVVEQLDEFLDDREDFFRNVKKD
ncbi:MAG TPA: hypothetical protein ENN65_03995 [Candidatus Hydrogenedentes bacterium]|nr:hypothetical protein [Candidatus Hydrogenedentota bacterium]